MEKVQEAAKMAFAHDFISELPNGSTSSRRTRTGGLLGEGGDALPLPTLIAYKVLSLDKSHKRHQSPRGGHRPAGTRQGLRRPNHHHHPP